MSDGWTPAAPPPTFRPALAGLLIAPFRLLALAVLVYGGLVLLLLVRLFEAPLCGARRPVTPCITVLVCRGALVIMGIRRRDLGPVLRSPGAIVANHSSWLDIFVLNALQPVYFVSKSEVSGWPGIGWLARATGTVFIRRDRKAAREQQALFEERLRAGHRLLFFPEGTSTDGRRVLPFKSTLFAAFYSHGLEHVMQIQPVSIAYHAPRDQDSSFYGWWGDMDFAGHFLKVISTVGRGWVEVIRHAPVAVDAFPSRKELARHCEEAVRAGLCGALDDGL